MRCGSATYDSLVSGLLSVSPLKAQALIQGIFLMGSFQYWGKEHKVIIYYLGLETLLRLASRPSGNGQAETL